MAGAKSNTRTRLEDTERVDPRNQLNELSNREWLKRTKSVWYSRPGPRDALKQQHPATFAESDVARLIELFTRSGQVVLDPFLGSGSTLIACLMTLRRGVGVELVNQWAQIARKRVELYISEAGEDFRGLVDPRRHIIEGDSRVVLGSFDEASFDFIVTSPPYWNILHNADGMKTAAERRGLATRYSNRRDDLGNVASYEEFLDQLCEVWRQCWRVLKSGRYMAVIVSDFRLGPRYYLYHADTARRVESVGFVLKGAIVLVQDNKNLYPYGIPRSFVPNVHHQNVLIFQKPREA